MSIRNKLITYTLGSVLTTVFFAWLVINFVLTELYEDNAHAELDYIHTQFKRKLFLIENSVLYQTLQVASSKSVLATVNMVNRYQDIKNYQPFIFDNDKKKLAEYLASQIILTDSEHALIYDKNGKLVVYAENHFQKITAGIVSYKNGEPRHFIKEHHSNEKSNWKLDNLPADIASFIKKPSIKMSYLLSSGKIEYISKEKGFIMENSRLITRVFNDGSVELLGVVTISKPIDKKFFSQLTARKDLQLSLLLQNGYVINPREHLLPVSDLEDGAELVGGKSSHESRLISHDFYYLDSYVWPTISGKHYLLISSPKSNLIYALNKTRIYLLVIFSAIALLVIFFGVGWLNRIVTNPLNMLVRNISMAENQKQPEFYSNKANDEISQLGGVLKQMFETINKKEQELRESTAQLTNAQRLAKLGNWQLEHVTESMKWSSEVYNILELDPDEQASSRDAILATIHPDDVDMVNNAFEESVLNKTFFDVVHRAVMKDGRIKIVRGFGETFFDKEGHPINSVGTMQDITEQVTRDEQLRRSQKMDAIGKLTGGIAHDFNNMLGVVLGYSELLKNDSSLGMKQKCYVDEVLHAGERAKKLTSKLLSFSRKHVSEATKTDINHLLQQEKDMLEKTLTVRIQLSYKREENLWPVWLDRGELEDAIVNMCINSMHAMPAGGELILSTLNTSLIDIDARSLNIPAGDYVLLSLTDTGAGMDSETLDHIFEPFYTTKNEKGTGLGMSQVYGFIQRSKGAIKVYSELGHGTRISLYFPRYLKDKDDVANKPVMTDSHEDLSGHESILVVDDEIALRNLAQEILESRGYKVLCANSGNQALEILAREHIDLMLSDVIMPEMDGYQLAAIVRDKYPQTVVQLASGFAETYDMTAINEDLYEHRLQKPFSSISLLRRVKVLLT